jgi:hypothetical protein
MTRDLSETITFEAPFADTPVFLADVQGQTASHARGGQWDQKSLAGVTVMVALDDTIRTPTTLKAAVEPCDTA